MRRPAPTRPWYVRVRVLDSIDSYIILLLVPFKNGRLYPRCAIRRRPALSAPPRSAPPRNSAVRRLAPPSPWYVKILNAICTI